MKNTIFKRITAAALSSLMLLAISDLSAFKFKASAAVDVITYDISTGDLMIYSDTGDYIITQSDSTTPTTNTITIRSGSHNITLSDVNIDLSGMNNYTAFMISDMAGDVNITLVGDNYLKSDGFCQPGLRKANVTSNLTINGNGSLTATGGYSAAGIGCSIEENANNIIINSGTVNATGGSDAAGIGGGSGGNGSNITINGGTVNATGGFDAAGIGGGYLGNGSNITINGGTVNATGGDDAAGIGGGNEGNGSNITINGGTVNATGRMFGAGIGGGNLGNGSDITIKGGDVVATGGDWAEGIGNGISGGPSENITITPLSGLKCSFKAGSDSENITYTNEVTNTSFDLTQLSGKRYFECKSTIAGAEIDSWNLSLKGNIGMNFNMLISDEVFNDQAAYVLFTMKNGKSKKVYVKDVPRDESNMALYSYDVCAPEMMDKVTISMVLGNGASAKLGEASIRDYADIILANTNNLPEYTKAQKLVNTMLHYGASTQVYFDYNTANLANEGIAAKPTDPAVLEFGDIVIPNDSLDGLSYYGTSLVLNSETTMRHYFTASGKTLGEVKAAYTFEVNGVVLEPQKKNGMFYIDIENIAAHQLNSIYDMTISHGTDTMTLKYKATAYIVLQSMSTISKELENVLVAMGHYSNAADEYMAPAPAVLDYNITPSGDTLLVTLSGDANATNLGALGLAILSKNDVNTSKVIFDATNLNSLDAEGAATLKGALGLLAVLQLQAEFTNVNSSVTAALTAVGLEGFIV